IYKNKRIKKIVTLTASDLLPIESAAETHNDTRASVAVAQALHQWLTYAVVDVPEPQEYLHRANHVVWSTLRSNGFDLWLYWLSIFFAIELGHMEKARDMLEVAYSHRSYYKRKAPFYYNVMHFLYASLEIKQNRIKSAEKYIRVLEASGNPLMLGMLYLALKEYEAAYKLLVASYKAGCRSIFLFNALLMYYRKTDNRQLQPSDQDLLQQVIRWAINRGADVERWQIQLPGLNRCIVQVAFENEAKQIRHYTMAQYLQNPDNDMDLQIYMYHLLLTDANLADLIDSQLDKIIQMAEYCQQNDIQGRHARSLYYFLWQQKLDNVLLEHIKQASWQAAADLIAQHGHLIKDRALFSAVKQFSDKSHEKWHPAIANAAYRLLLHSRYDKRMLDVVLTHFKGSQAQWLALSHALSAISIHEPRLDEIILKNATWAHHFDEETQRIFIRSTANQRAAGLWDFICYAAHEMIVGNVRPLTETIVALERLHSEGADKQAEDHILLTYGLCHVYLTHDIHTFRSEAIIQEAIQMQEKSGIIFPVFRGSKKISSTYIEKYRPFMYKTLPGKDVRLYYKVDGEGDWRVKNMGYWRFGLYLARVPHFYNEVLTYYFSEEMPTGSIATREAEIHNKDMHLDESQTDPFFIINNATIYEQMFRYEQVEEIIGGLVKDVRNVRSRLM
ncbi:MAG: DUF5717 family protein, partial [Defluviitaleaceae bacterium]|nr:DUF5717 family protein [Defluviitaleaceae bacterium]